MVCLVDTVLSVDTAWPLDMALPYDDRQLGCLNSKRGCRSMASATAGYELPLLLFGGFRAIIDELHAELARRGHPELRPAHGFAMQAIGLPGATASDVGKRLGISKQ